MSWTRLVALMLVVLGLCLGGLSGAAVAEEDGADDGGAEEAPPEGFAWRAAGTEGLLVRGLSSLRIHPKNADVLWAYVHGMGPAMSDDGGRTWKAMLKGVPEKALPGLRSRVRISFDPQKVKTIYCVIDGQIFRSDDSGENWESVTSGALASLSWSKLNSTHLSWQVEVDPKKSVRLLVGTANDGNHNGGLFESKNGGKAWEQVSGTDLPKSGLGNDTFLIRQDPKSDKYLTVAGRRALWRSDDIGRKFERNDPAGPGIHDYRDLSYQTSGLKDLFVADAHGVWRSKDGGKKWEKKPARKGDALVVRVDPHNRKRVYAVFHDSGLWVSEDPRKTKWEQLGGAFGKVEEGTENPPIGYRDAVIREVVVHPRERKTMYLTSPETGLHVSLDAGKTFSQVMPPEGAKPETVIPETMPPIALVGVHPTRGGAQLAVTAEGVVYASTGRDASAWERRGRLGMRPGALVPDAAAKTWWALGRMLLRSTDDGATWAAVGPMGTDDDANPEERVLALWRGAGQDGKPGPLRILLERTGVVMSSDDDGETWKASKAAWKPAKGDGDKTWAAAFAVDPSNPDHMVIAARTTREAPSRSDENGGVFETWDGGKGWKDITGDLKPGKKDGAAARRAKANWNRAAFLGIDAGSKTLVYGASGRGVFARALGTAKDKQEKAPWVDVTPKAPERPRILASAFTKSEDGKDSRVVLQLGGENGEIAMYAIDGAMLKSLHDLRAGVEGAPEDAAWTALPSPGETVRLSSLAADALMPGRLIGSDAAGDRGVLIYEDPNAKAAAGGGSDEEGESEDEGSKDESGEGSGEPVTLNPPEGMRAFTCGQDNAVRIWRVDQAKRTADVPGHEGPVTCIALTPDEQFLVTAGEDKTVRIWKASNGEAVASIPTESVVTAIVIDDDSKYAYAALGDKKQVLQIEIASKTPKAFDGHTDAVTALAASDDVNRVYSGGKDGTVRVWDTQQGTQVNEIAVGAPVTAIAVSTDAGALFAASADGALRTYDATGKEVAKVDLKAPANSLRISPDGKTLFCGTTGGVQAMAAAPGGVAGAMHAAPDQTIHGLTLSADGLWLLAGDAKGGLWLWAVGTPEARWSKTGHMGPIHGVAVTPDETELEMGGGGGGGDAAKPADKPEGDAAPKDAPGEPSK